MSYHFHAVTWFHFTVNGVSKEGFFCWFSQKSRYEVYLKVLEAWQALEKSDPSVADRLNALDEGLWTGSMDEQQDEADAGMKRSHSSPSLELETPPQPVVKVRRNISERRTYRKIVIPRRNKEL